MNTFKLNDDFYWTGIVDRELKTFDIVMETEFGTTYNSYVLKAGNKVILFETAKAKFFDDYCAKVSSIVNINQIDYLVVNHTEPDHAGSIEKLLDINPDIVIIATQAAINFLKEITNREFKFQIVKDKEELSIGNRTLRFLIVPNLHWPDTMYTYLVEDKILVTCDSFGAHYSKNLLLSEVEDFKEYLKASKYYFDNILGPFKKFVQNALLRIRSMDIKFICTGHGPIVDTRINDMMNYYQDWANTEVRLIKKTVIVYVSAYGYTKALADRMYQSLFNTSGIDVECIDLEKADINEVKEKVRNADGVLFGSPTILNDALAPVMEVVNALSPAIYTSKVVSAFGSYGWSGEAVGNILRRCKELRLNVLDEGFKVKFKPTDYDLDKAYEYAYEFAKVVMGK